MSRTFLILPDSATSVSPLPPLPIAQPLPSLLALPGPVLSIVRPPLPYQVGGVALPDKPTVCTAPFLQGTSVPVGSVFTLLWSNPSTATQNALPNGATVSLTFALFSGQMVTGLVQIASSLTSTGLVSIPRVFGGTVLLAPSSPLFLFQVTVTLVQTIQLNQWVVKTQFL